MSKSYGGWWRLSRPNPQHVASREITPQQRLRRGAATPRGRIGKNAFGMRKECARRMQINSKNHRCD
ncbi:hypothetical protein [Roseomonas sp. 18066]|uniref:hypothetical protein n=1 Tax=Roseomonas sp. 18066 TaxID=2681412 RepID=UPI00135CA029|nr:hypothetical protein [Roseomonas sp. 18066]